MAPVWTIIIFAVIGLVANGLLGALLGGLVGLVATFVIGGAVNLVQGGPIPRKVRRDLVVKLISNYPVAIERAFPGKVGDDLFREIDQRVNTVVRKAASIAPSNSVVLSQPVIMEAITRLATEEPDGSVRDFYLCMIGQIGKDWYS